jgi:mannosyltransferase OCH1-like enzyme
MIPKKIHFCWFSGEAYPESVQRCMDSWRKHLPDFELVHWDAEKARATGIAWVSEALEQKKWAFAADAVRLYALWTEGGIYLDTDVEVLRLFDDLLERPYFFGYENGSKRIEGAVMGCEPGCEPVAAALEYYKAHAFTYSEGDVDQMVLPNILREAFGKFNLEILPESAFSPKSYIDGKIRATEETYCIHHFSSDWRPESVRKGIRRRQWLFATFPRPLAKILTVPLSLWTNLTTLGVRGTIRKLNSL